MLHPSLYAASRHRLAPTTPAPRPAGGAGARMLAAMRAYDDARAGTDREQCADRAQSAVAGDQLLDAGSGAFAYACRVLVVADRFDAAADAYERALSHARTHHSISAFALGMAFRGGLALYRGQLAEAEEDTRAAVDAARTHGVGAALPFALTYLALVLLEQGELGEAAATLDCFAGEAPGFAGQPFVLFVRGRLRRLEGDLQAADAAMLEAGRRYESGGQRNPALAPWRSEAVLVKLALGDHDGARALADEELALARTWGAPATLGRALRVAGLAHGSRHASVLLRESLDVLADTPADLERAKTLVELGGAVRRGGRRADARTLLRQGLELADRCSARALTERARSELRAAGSRPRRTSLSGVPALTPSERRVASMAASGMTNRDIAQALFVTPKTVEVHLSASYRKLDIRSRVQLPRALAG
jgi:ATP/maltotriose-dependent transcriptional regulator MalT